MKNKEIVNKYKEMFNECITISEKYKLSINGIEKNIEEIDSFRVTTPVIGGFSTGKSSMINAILEEKIVETEITPETAVPTEIYYGNNRVLIYNKGREVEEVSIDQFRKIELDATVTKLVKVEYDNDFLREIKEVNIVDMPGFDSGIELHNKAIDNYLPKSLAYIVTFSADEPVIKESISNFLRELKLHEVPVYIVITKCDKVTKERLHECKEFIKENVSKTLEIDDFKIACVKSKRDRDTDEVKKIFLEIQRKSQQIFEKYFSSKLRQAVSLMEKYIVSRLNNKELSNLELEIKEQELEKNMAVVLEKLKKEKGSFDNQIQKCIDAIKIKIGSDLSAASTTLETMILNGNDIKEKANIIVRNATMAGIKSEFEPKIQKYLKNVTELIDVNIMLDTEVNLDGFKIAADNMVKDVVIKSIPVVFAAIGGVLGGPIGAIVGGAVAVFVDTLFKSKHEREKRDIVKQKVQGEIIPHIVDESSKCVEIELISYVKQINEEIQFDIEKQLEVMKKALEDIKIQKEKEEQIQKEQIKELKNDLEKARGMINGI